MTQIIRDAHAEASGDKHRIMPLLASRIEEQCPQITYEFRDKTTWSYRMGAALHDAAEVLEDIKGTVSSIEVGLTSCCRREKRSGGKTHYEEDVSQATAAPHTREQRDDVLANSTQYAGISSEGEGSQTTLVHRHAATAASSEASAASNSI